MKRIAPLIFCLFLIKSSPARAQETPAKTVRDYAALMKEWSETGKDNLREEVKKLCEKGNHIAIFTDSMSLRMAKLYAHGQKDELMLELYLISVQKHIDNGGQILFSDLQAVPANSIEVTAPPKGLDPKALSYFTAHASLGTNEPKEYQVLFHVRKDFITKVGDYVRPINGKTKVDLSYLQSDESFGMTYNYGKHWPLGISANYRNRIYMISGDLGINLDRDKKHTRKLEMTDVMNFNLKEKELNPYAYLTATPSIFLKFVSIGCGAGIAYMRYQENNVERVMQESGKYSTGDSMYTQYTQKNTTTDIDGEALKLIVRPALKVFIPVHKEWNLSLGVSYDYIFTYKEMNGINYSLGLQYNLT